MHYRDTGALDTWARLSAKATLTPAEQMELRALPAGARMVPLDWVAATAVEQKGYFDRDMQEESFVEQRVLTAWLAEPDPRVQHAGLLCLHGIERMAIGMIGSWPGVDRWGAELSALRIPSHLLQPQALEWVGNTRRWRDLSVHWGRGSDVTRAAMVHQLGGAFPDLLGLELHGAYLKAEQLALLAQAPFLPQLLDLTLNGSPLPPAGARAVFERLGELQHLDLRDARLDSDTLALLAPKLRRARRIQLCTNSLGDAGLRTLLDTGALGSVEDLWLTNCELTDRSAHALANATLPALRGLWISGNRMTDAGVQALVRSPLFAQLSGVALAQPGLGQTTAALLANNACATV